MTQTSSEAVEQATPTAPERGMRFMLAVLVVFVVVQDIFDLHWSLGPGLSAKNALLYLLAAALAFKFAVQGFRIELKSILISFGVLIGYSIFSILAAEWVVDYPRYDAIDSAISLKAKLADQLIFFLVFFYGLKGSANAAGMLKLLLVAVVIANAMAVLDAWGFVEVGGLEQRADGRIQGVMGESNQYAAFVTLFLPALAAATVQSRNVWRLFWLGGLLICTAGMVMAVSRGAFVALLISAIWGALLFRRYVSPRKIIAAGAIGFLFLVIVLVILSARYGDLLAQRLLAESSGDLTAASSGRSEIWATAIARMFQSPLTLLTGFGWDVYWTMPFRYSPHNHYVGLWFNLGLPGLICGTLLLVYAVRNALAAVTLSATYRPILIAFVLGTLAFAVATFFVDLYVPWLWFWAYAGLVLRIAVNVHNAHANGPAPLINQTQPATRADPYGWTAAARGAR